MAIVLAVTALEAAAAPPRPSGRVRPGTIVVGLDGDGRTPRRRSTGSGATRYRCTYLADEAGAATSRRITLASVPPGGAYWRRCTEISTGRAGALRRFVVPGAPGFSDELPVPLPPPAIQLSPAAERGTVVGLETWMWVDAWDPVSQPLTREGTTVIAIGVPKRVRWEVTSPDGATSTTTCDGPGLPYGTAPPAADDRQPCTRRFSRAGTHQVRAVIEWEVGWIATDGSSQELGQTTSASTVEVAVHELDTVIAAG